MITRRGLFGVLIGAVAAPIVVRSGILMPVKRLIVPLGAEIGYYRYEWYDHLSDISPDPGIKSGLHNTDFRGCHRYQALADWKSAFEREWEKAVG